MKTCYKCGEDRAIDEFQRDRTRPDGLQSMCKPCMHARCASWNRKHPERRSMIAARGRAKRDGLTFTLTAETMPQIPEVCPCCAVRLEVGAENGGLNTSPSLDRLDNTRGYEPENVWWICNACNVKKANMDPPEMYLIADTVWAEMKRRGLPLPATKLRPNPNEENA